MMNSSPRSDSVSSKSNDLVKLNVGGTRLVTTMTTLSTRGPNFLTVLIENDKQGKICSQRDERGYYFIDRSGDVFKVVLEYLRTGHLHLPQGMSQKQIEIECDYYQVTLPKKTTNKMKREFSQKDGPTKKLSQLWKKISKVEKSVREWLQENQNFILQYCIDSLTKYDKKHASLYFSSSTGDPPFVASTGSSSVSLPCRPDPDSFWVELLCNIIANEWNISASFQGYSLCLDWAQPFLQGDSISDIYKLLKSYEVKNGYGKTLLGVSSWSAGQLY